MISEQKAARLVNIAMFAVLGAAWLGFSGYRFTLDLLAAMNVADEPTGARKGGLAELLSSGSMLLSALGIAWIIYRKWKSQQQTGS